MSNTTVVFRNKGLIDVRSIQTFGVSSKENENAIGFFGTGLKYAIAILLRHNIQVSIFIGLKRYDFDTETTTIRKDEFKIVTMNGQPLGFTTELGKTWQLWQAFREIYCNTKDEHGVMEVIEGRIVDVEADETTVVVWGEEFTRIARTMGEYILDPEHKPVFAGSDLQAFPGPSNYVYYQGVRAYELQKPTYFMYNITAKLELTEDRTIKYIAYLNIYVARTVSRLTNKRAIETMVTLPDGYFEQTMDFCNTSVGQSDEFKETVISLVRGFKPVNKSAQKVCQASILDALDGMKESELTEMDSKKVTRSVAFLKSLGHDVDSYPIVITDYLGDNILGRACNGKIYISKRTIMQGTKQIAATILEEFLHLRYGLVDETYHMQSFLFDMIIGLGEQVVGDPL